MDDSKESKDSIVAETSKDEESLNNKKEKYPKVVLLIILNEFCERFSFYGLKTILYIYFTKFIFLSKDTATAIYHSYTTICYFTPIIGAIIADGYIGLYYTIISLSIVYFIGELIVTLTSIVPLGAPNVYGPVIGLLIIALGTGGIKPCVGAFGANQFKPTQAKYLENFFSVFYLSINIGSTIGTILTPIFRSDVKCFGNDCYPLAFGVPAVFMFTSIIIFFIGTKYYNRSRVRNGKNIIVQTFKCIYVALANKFKYSKKIKHNHWLEYAQESNFSVELINDVKAFTRVFFVFLPLPIFWALYDQQGSRWTEQAQQLSGRIGKSFTIKPDQFQAINPILIVTLVPLFDLVIYPLFAKLNLFKKQLPRMIVGLILASVSFGIAAVLESQMQKASAQLNPANQIKLLNLAPCELKFAYQLDNAEKTFEVKEAEYLNTKAQVLPKDLINLIEKNEQYELKLSYKCSNGLSNDMQLMKLNKTDLPRTVIFYTENGQINYLDYYYSIDKQVIGSSQIKFATFLGTNSLGDIQAELYNSKITYSEIQTENFTSTQKAEYSEVDYTLYNLRVLSTSSLLPNEQNKTLLDVKDSILLETCGRYTVLFFLNTKQDKLDYVLLTDIYQNGIHIAWQLIQIFVMTLAEIMFSISGVSFAYSQAPASMKSVLQATWFMTIAFGNLIVVIVAEARIKDQVYEYVFFACLLTLATLVFIFLSYNYKYVEDEQKDKKGSGNSVAPIQDIETKDRSDTFSIDNEQRF